MPKCGRAAVVKADYIPYIVRGGWLVFLIHGYLCLMFLKFAQKIQQTVRHSLRNVFVWIWTSAHESL